MKYLFAGLLVATFFVSVVLLSLAHAAYEEAHEAVRRKRAEQGR